MPDESDLVVTDRVKTAIVVPITVDSRVISNCSAWEKRKQGIRIIGRNGVLECIIIQFWQMTACKKQTDYCSKNKPFLHRIHRLLNYWMIYLSKNRVKFNDRILSNDEITQSATHQPIPHPLQRQNLHRSILFQIIPQPRDVHVEVAGIEERVVVPYLQ